MGKSKWVMAAFAAAVLAAGMLFAAACGGDDNSNKSGPFGNNSNSNSKSETTAPASNSTAKSNPTQGSSGGGSVATGSDEQYVKDVCNAGTKLMKTLQKVEASPTPSDPVKGAQQVFAALADPLDQFAKDLAKAKPPKDLADWHAETVKRLQATVKALKSNDFQNASNIFSDIADPMPDMPQGAQDRLDKIAQSTSECKDFNAFNNKGN